MLELSISKNRFNGTPLPPAPNGFRHNHFPESHRKKLRNR